MNYKITKQTNTNERRRRYSDFNITETMPGSKKPKGLEDKITKIN